MWGGEKTEVFHPYSHRIHLKNTHSLPGSIFTFSMETKLVDLPQDVKIVSKRNYLGSDLKMSLGSWTEAFKSHDIRHSVRLLSYLGSPGLKGGSIL
jgi:hypothetical protein